MRRALLALIACAVAGTAAAQSEEGQLTYRPVAVFNQHLYYGAFSRPRAVAYDREHKEVWIADSGHGVVSIHRPDGGELFAFVPKDVTEPIRIALAPNGRVALVDTGHGKIRLFDYRGTPKGDLKLTGVGEKPVIGAIAFDADGNAYVGENRSRQIFVYRPDGSLKFQFGSPGGDEGQFESIGGITVDGAGNIYVIDHRAICVQVFDKDGNFVRGWGKHEMGAGNFSLPSGIAVDGQGRVIVSDELRHTVKVFASDGKLLAQFGGLGNDVGQFSFPTDVAADADGRIFVVERATSRAQVFEPVLVKSAE